MLDVAGRGEICEAMFVYINKNPIYHHFQRRVLTNKHFFFFLDLSGSKRGVRLSPEIWSARLGSARLGAARLET